MARESTGVATMRTSGQIQDVDELCPHSPGYEVPLACIEEMLGTLAHELRNPLATIVTAVQVVTSGYDIDPTARQALAIVEGQSRRAMRLVEDLFDLCASSWGKLSLDRQVVELTDVVRGAIETTTHLLDARRHRLAVSLPSEPVFIYADSVRLEQVLTNLLTNAAKFTAPGGHVWLSAEAEGGWVELRVRDNGRGIAPDLLPRLFDLYYQVPGSSTHQAGGLGIGLALVKSLVELHGGRVAVASDGVGCGSEFVVSLPDYTHGAC